MINGKILVDTIERQFVLDGDFILYMMPLKKSSEEFTIKFKNGVNILITEEEFTQICGDLGLLENQMSLENIEGDTL